MVLPKIASEWQSAFYWVLTFVLTALMALNSWGIYSIHNLEVRVAAIEGNRFTASDAQRLYDLINDKQDKANSPPQWFREEVLSMKADLKEIEARLRAIEIAVSRK